MENFDVIAESVVGAIIQQACQGVEDRLGEERQCRTFVKIIGRHDGGLRGPDLAHQRGLQRGRGQGRHPEIRRDQVETLARLEIHDRVGHAAKIFIYMIFYFSSCKSIQDNIASYEVFKLSFSHLKHSVDGVKVYNIYVDIDFIKTILTDYHRMENKQAI